MIPTHNTTSPGPRLKKTRRARKKKKKATSSVPVGQGVDSDAMDDDLLPTDTTASIHPRPEGQAVSMAQDDDDDVVMIDPLASEATSSLPAFPPLPASAHASTTKSETRRILIPPHRMTPLQKDWINIFSPLTEMCGLQVRMNILRKCVEMRVRLSTNQLLAVILTIVLWLIDVQAYQRGWCTTARSRFCQSICFGIRC